MVLSNDCFDSMWQIQACITGRNLSALLSSGRPRRTSIPSTATNDFLNMSNVNDRKPLELMKSVHIQYL